MLKLIKKDTWGLEKNIIKEANNHNDFWDFVDSLEKSQKLIIEDTLNNQLYVSPDLAIHSLDYPRIQKIIDKHLND
jgi:hypothetical protein